MKKLPTAIVLLALPLAGSLALAGKAEKVTVKVNLIDKTGTQKPAGTVTLSDGKGGLMIAPNLKGLPPGEHGFHIHEKGSCEPAEKDGAPMAGLAAGGHFDPDGTKAHKGPGGGGHKGDLPKLEVSDKGDSKAKLEVAGVKLADVRGKALMIHANGDNYSDSPKPLGGGGDRIACGVIPEAK
ncbi:MAG TPA: superoxide dismutase [Cu-Zn] SodC [Polyangia bacterium]|nr:superoxide dismutase [Cu-Zn] SodC [Polyangia bacterium]